MLYATEHPNPPQVYHLPTEEERDPGARDLADSAVRRPSVKSVHILSESRKFTLVPFVLSPQACVAFAARVL